MVLVIQLFAALAVAGVFCALLMGVTIVGVCKYGDRYSRFFEELKPLEALATVRRMAKVYLSILDSFLGKNVGFKQPGVLDKPKYTGYYIEHLLLFYWISGTILVLAFRPVEPVPAGANSLLQAAAFVTLLTMNVASDAISLLWTKRCIALLAVPETPPTLRILLVVLAQDVGVAFGLMIVVQLVSNGLYAIQIGRPREIFVYMFDLWTAFKPYAAVAPEFSAFQFPGQLVITCTTYVPSLLFYVICLVILCLVPFYRLLVWFLGVFNLQTKKRHTVQRRPSCNQVTFITSLVGVFGLAIGSAALFVGAWPYIR
jgi:hypothetical protein